MNILEEIAAYTTKRIEEAKRMRPAAELEKEAFALPKGDFAFEKALRKEGLSFICECKKASPSKGIIAEDFPYLQIAKEYEQAGADCLSVLTEPKWFLGSDGYVREIAAEVKIPILRKDFTVDEYMIFQAKLMGASAVLLIVAILTPEQIKSGLKLCDELGLSALVETHDEAEADIALNAGARVIGVNNRNLKDFSVDNTLADRMRRLIPREAVFVSESGIKDAEDVKRITEAGADAVLIGETLMRAADKKQALRKLKGL
ncbi:MAG: indole-3-glycerol phosphate synthase TrpC [Lachnospiraceae bacterium]|nr:indole-3-glycerol phosphate synthase TrpC [Lachnospiraceae bacterium]